MNHADTIEKLALEGPLSLHQLIALGVVAALVIGWLTWRDCKLSGAVKLFAVLVLTRLAVLAVVLWMLAGATVVTLKHDTRAKSIIVLVDSSGSMGMVDPVDGSGDTLRWSEAGAKSASLPALAALDRATGTLRAAQSGANQIAQADKSGDSFEQSQETWQEVRQSVTAAAEEAGKAATEVAAKDTENGAELGRIAAFLREGLAAPGSSTGLTRQTVDDRLEEMNSLLEAGLRRIEVQSRKLAAAHESTPTSAEQATFAAQSKLARNEKITAWLEAGEKTWLKDLEGSAHVLRYTFNSETQPVADRDWRAALTGPSNSLSGVTDLGAALGRAVQDAAKQSVAAVVLVTDGGHNAAGDPRDLAAALRGVPLNIVPIGTTVMPRDVILHHVQAPRAAFKNDSVVVDAMVTAFNCPGESLEVELLGDGKVVDHKTLTAESAMFDGRVNFHWKAAELGRHVLKVRVVPLANEASLDNNEAQIPVEVMEDTMHVLLADDLPRWEFRYLANLFKRDKHIEFEQLLFSPNDGPAADTRPAFPKDDEAWRRYRVIILGDVTPEELPPAQQERLRQYVVEGGGNLIVIAGETAMPAAFVNQPLGAMIPAEAGAPAGGKEGFGLTVTPEGSTSAATQLEDDSLASERIWRDMSTRLPIYNLSAIAKPKPTSHVLINATRPGQRGEPEAFLSWQYIGLGRVIYLAAPVTYELRYGKGDVYHHRFWGQLLRWAIAREMGEGSKTVHLNLDKNSYSAGDEAQVVMRLSRTNGTPVAAGQARIEALRDNRIIKLVTMSEQADSPGTYRGVFENLPAGPVTLRAAGATVESLLHAEGHPDPVQEVINVETKGTVEMSNPLANLPLLRQIADASGGSLLPPAAVPGALTHLNVAPETMESVLSRRPLWNRWSYLWIFVGCLTLEWLARRRWRMV